MQLGKQALLAANTHLFVSCTGNNVMRTIHGVGEMMTQMVLSRGSVFPISSPDVQPSLHPSKQASTSDSEDVIVMDTKLKIIEILQVIMVGVMSHHGHFMVLCLFTVASSVTCLLSAHWAGCCEI